MFNYLCKPMYTLMRIVTYIAYISLFRLLIR